MFRAIPFTRITYLNQLRESNLEINDYFKQFPIVLHNIVAGMDALNHIGLTLMNRPEILVENIIDVMECQHALMEELDRVLSEFQALDFELSRMRLDWLKDPAVQACSEITYLKNSDSQKIPCVKNKPVLQLDNQQHCQRELLDFQNAVLESFNFFKWDLQEILFYLPEPDLHQLLEHCWEAILESDQAWISLNHCLSAIVDEYAVNIKKYS